MLFGLKTRFTLLFQWRGTGMLTGMPLSVCWHLWPLCSQMLTKTFCWGSLSSLPWETREAVELSHGISQQLRPEWKLGALALKGSPVIWVLDFILKYIYAVFCPPPHFPSFFFFVFKLQTFPSGWIGNYNWMLLLFSPFHLHLGDHEMLLSRCLLWKVTAGPFSRKLSAISAIMLIFTCVPCRTEFLLCTETSPENCCKTKSHQSTKSLNESLSGG